MVRAESRGEKVIKLTVLAGTLNNTKGLMNIGEEVELYLKNKEKPLSSFFCFVLF